jgi:hypothetical protein
MRLLHLLPLPALALTACDPFGKIDADGWVSIDKDIWDTDLAVTDDGAYVELPHAGALLNLDPAGKLHIVDLKGAGTTRLRAIPDASGLLVGTRWPVCADPDPEIIYKADCPKEDLSWESELALVQGKDQVRTWKVPSHLDLLSFSADNQIALAWRDPNNSAPIESTGVIDLTEIVRIPLDGGDPTAISLGASPRTILFTQATESDHGRAVILSRSTVTVLDLLSGEVVVTYPLVLDVDDVIEPVSAILTGNDRYAVVAVQHREELYRLDLEQQSIDLEDVADEPSRLLAIDRQEDPIHLVAYRSTPQLDIFDGHTNELIHSIELDIPVNKLVPTANSVIAAYLGSSDGNKDVYRIDLETMERTEFRAANPLTRLYLTEDERFVVGWMSTESSSASTEVERWENDHPGLFVLDLQEDQETSLSLSSEPVGFALTEQEGVSYALLLLEGSTTLLQIDLTQPSFPKEIELPAMPAGIGALTDGRFWISLESPLGMISVLDPATGKMETVEGFGTLNLFDRPTLPRR